MDHEEKYERTLKMSDTTYKVLCSADSLTFDASTGLLNLVNIYRALKGHIDFREIEIKRAQLKAKELNLFPEK